MTASIWHFALDFYGREDVSAACLALQDEADVDVVHLIAVTYADWIGQPLQAEEIKCLRDVLGAWRAGVVIPLRAVRRFLKTPVAGFEARTEALRSTVKSVELKAEQLQLDMAHAWLMMREPGEGLSYSQALESLLKLSSSSSVSDDRLGSATATLLSARAAIGSATANPAPTTVRP